MTAAAAPPGRDARARNGAPRNADDTEVRCGQLTRGAVFRLPTILMSKQRGLSGKMGTGIRTVKARMLVIRMLVLPAIHCFPCILSTVE